MGPQVRLSASRGTVCEIYRRTHDRRLAWGSAPSRATREGSPPFASGASPASPAAWPPGPPSSGRLPPSRAAPPPSPPPPFPPVAGTGGERPAPLRREQPPPGPLQQVRVTLAALLPRLPPPLRPPQPCPTGAGMTGSRAASAPPSMVP